MVYRSRRLAFIRNASATFFSVTTAHHFYWSHYFGYGESSYRRSFGTRMAKRISVRKAK